MSSRPQATASVTGAGRRSAQGPGRVGHLIDGEWEHGQAELESTNPARPEQVVTTFPAGDADVVEAAVAAARQAQPGWAGASALRRGRILQAAASEVDRRRRELALLVTTEEGKPLREAEAEVGRVAEILSFHAGQTSAASGEIFGASSAQQIRAVRFPLGVVGVITPWNFPIAIPAWKIGPALAHGNAVVWKPSSQTPAVAAAFAQILDQAGVPAGVLNLVLGPSSVGEALAEADGLDGLTFTGSEGVGGAIAAKRAGQIKLQLELGGNSPAVVFADCDLELAVSAVTEGAMGSTGQKCTATRRALVAKQLYDEFVERLLARVEELRLGDGAEASTDVGPLISAAALEEVERDVMAALDEGGRLLTPREAEHPEQGHFFAPAVISDLPLDGETLQREIFGPVLSVTPFDGVDEALRLANHTRYGLSAAAFTNDLGLAERVIQELDAGLLHLNRPSTGAEAHVPFGGLKGSSGPGAKEQGTQAREFFTDLKTIYVDFAKASG